MTRTTVIKVKENSYDVSFPTVGQLIDIENMKAILSNGMYGNILSSRTTDSEYVLNLIDMEAYFTILIPKLIKDLKVKSFRDLQIEDSLELNSVFINSLLPFIKQWRDIISKPIDSNDDK